MTWPGWGDVLPLLTTLVTTLVTVIGAVVTWVRISDRTVSQAVEKVARQSEKAAREAAAGVSAEVKALAEKLATSDFPHVEARIERGLAAAGGDREAMESRIGERLDRTGGRIERMGGRLDRMGGRIERMEARLREDAAAMGTRILAAVQRHPDTGDSESGPRTFLSSCGPRGRGPGRHERRDHRHHPGGSRTRGPERDELRRPADGREGGQVSHRPLLAGRF